MNYRKEAKKRLIHNYNLKKKEKLRRIMEIHYKRIAKSLVDFYGGRPAPNLLRFLEESQKDIQYRDYIYKWQVNTKEK